MDKAQICEVVCRRCGNVFELRLRLSDGAELPPRNCYECRDCCADRSVLDCPEEIARQLERKNFSDKWKIYKFLAWVRGHREGCYVEYPNGTFDYVHGYVPYRRERVARTASEWREKNKERARDYKRLTGKVKNERPPCPNHI
jgi:hypothetical protein